MTIARIALALLIAVAAVTTIREFISSRPLATESDKHSSFETRVLTREQAQLLAMNTPAALASKKNGGCPEAELDFVDDKERLAAVQVRKICPKAGTGLINSFTVDLNNGEFWIGDRTEDHGNVIDSDELRGSDTDSFRKQVISSKWRLTPLEPTAEKRGGSAATR